MNTANFDREPILSVPERSELSQMQLEAAYQQSSEEIDPDWKVTIADGLDDEATDCASI